ncbi:MAG: hypothetical protein ACJ79H_08965 [Myxococcales bacterium]
MADFFGIPRRRLPIAIAMVLLLAVTLVWLQGKFDQSDVKKGIALALDHRPAGRGGRSVFDGLMALGRGDPRCDGKVVSGLLGDVDVRCILPGEPDTEYEFRVLLDGKRPPRPASPPAERLVSQLQR